ncbi:helix-turn-helix transcriptional regulator [Bradyrhizobium sp. 186]|uniref:ATP-binding protein n=1 Tax=Bradyrhizobium sp. 186 TaxID=2782654 RepID=UPI002001428D|nr:winged helix-turn-helix domain-containing protein [Bradyrhizobium sp. 186]UPK37200.1 helix-turn-helix transcriptional regulator [Bradyrhizobium sp. 186]
MTDVVSFGPFRLFAAERLLEKADEPLELGSRALDILIMLVERAGEVVTHKELMSRAWPNVTVDEANLRVHVAGLRKALGEGRDGARFITNVSGRGYCFVAPVTRLATQRPAPQVRKVVSDRLRQLPAQLARMVGRDDTVRALSAQLLTRRLVSIVGPGGMGKTTVAVSIAHALIDDFDGAVFFVDLGALTDPSLVPTAVASALGLMIQAQDPLLSLLAFLGDRRALLLLDSCEHVIEAAAALAEPVVSAGPQVHILTTSREALRVEGEHVHLLYPLDSPLTEAGLTAVEALLFPTVQLFMERAAASGYRSELSDSDAPIVAGMCRKLDGIALAIELAASQVGFYGIRGTAELFDNRFKLLWLGRRTAMPRHQTLNAMLDWSYNLLPERDRLVLCRLSVFIGVFTLREALSVAGTASNDPDVTVSVASLVTKSLVSTTVIDDRTYYRLLDTTQAFAAGKLDERGEADGVARRHAVYYSKYLENREVVKSAVRGQDLSGFAQHVGNVRAALEWAFSDHGDIAIGAELATWAAPLFVSLSLLDECRKWCERALAALGDTERSTKTEMILQEFLALSSMFTKGNGSEVRTAIERGLSLAETLVDRDHQLQLLAGLNIFLTRIADFRGALAVAERGVSIADAAKDLAGLVITDWMLGVSYHLVGNQAAAQHHCESGMARSVELGQSNASFFGYDHRVRALVALARALWLRGFPERAVQVARQAIDEAERQDQPVSVCIALIYAAPVFLWSGNFERAGGYIERLIAYAGRYLLAPYRAVGMALKGELAVIRGEAGAGLHLLRDALETLHAEQHKILVTVFTGALADGLRKAGQFDEALLTINGALARAAHCGATFDMPELLRIKGQILATMPRRDLASGVDCLMQSIAVAREQSALGWELRSAMDLARLLSESGQYDQARDTLVPVYDRFTEGFETADLRAARCLIGDLVQ